MTCSLQWECTCVLHTSLAFDIELDVITSVEAVVRYHSDIFQTN